MNQERPIEQSVFSKLTAIWIVVIVIITATAIISGSQVYYWQKAVAQKERQRLEQRITNLQKEIQVLKTNNNIVTVQKNNKTAPTAKANQNSKLLESELAGREREVISLLQNGDLQQLAKYIHPMKGVRFSPFAYVDLKNDQVFSNRQLPGLLSNKKVYTWGYNEENGMPIRLNPSDYYKTFIYDEAYADTKQITYNRSTGSDFISNCFEAYPKAIIVEYRVNEPGSKENTSPNWRSIRLVFEAVKTTWFLSGIIHDQWVL